MLRSAISAFTHVFDSLCLRRGALLIRDPCIATRESMADVRYKEMLVQSSADDILLTTAFTGLETNMLRPSIAAAGLDPDDLPQRGAIDIAADIDVGA